MRSLLRSALLALGIVVSLSNTAGAQIQYDGTFFLHGFQDTRDRWLHYNSPGKLSEKVILGSYNVATTTSSTASLDYQARELHDYYLFSSLYGRSVLLGHSAGGLVARDSYLSTDPTVAGASRIAGIVTVATPHQGAPIADAANRVLQPDQPKLVEYFFDAIAAKLINPAAGLSSILGAVIVNYVQDVIVNRLKALARDQFGIDTPAAQDLRVGSAVISRLQATDAAPHANVYGTIGKRNAALKVYGGIKFEDPNPWIRSKNRVKSGVKACAQILYNVIIRTGLGRMCHQADHAIGSFDGRWNDWTHGPDKTQPFDGFIPRDHSQYPGLPITGPGNFNAEGENHGTITYGTNGIRAMADAMLYIRMKATPPPVTVYISGPSSVSGSGTFTWTANQGGGTGSYTYQWRYKLEGSTTWTNLGTARTQSRSVADGGPNFTMAVTVRSGTGSAVDEKLVLSIPSSCGRQFIC